MSQKYLSKEGAEFKRTVKVHLTPIYNYVAII